MASTVSPDLAQAVVATAAPVTPSLASIVFATDGSADSDAAVLLAQSYADRTGATLRGVSVCEPLPVLYDGPPFSPVYIPGNPELDEANRAAAVRAQMLRLLGSDARIPSTVTTGEVGSAIAEYAQSVAADLIITGRGKHGVLDRLLGEEHLARLLRTATCPVLAAEPTLVAPPRRVAVGIDFSPRSLAVARLAKSLMAEDGAMYLVHVKPDPPFGVPHPGQWLKSYDNGVRTALEQVRAQLAFPATFVVEPIVVNGHPGVALADFAGQSRSELIAVGVHGAGFFNRLVIGSVTTYLLRGAPCSLLAVPGPRTTADR